MDQAKATTFAKDVTDVRKRLTDVAAQRLKDAGKDDDLSLTHQQLGLDVLKQTSDFIRDRGGFDTAGRSRVEALASAVSW